MYDDYRSGPRGGSETYRSSSGRRSPRRRDDDWSRDRDSYHARNDSRSPPRTRTQDQEPYNPRTHRQHVDDDVDRVLHHLPYDDDALRSSDGAPQRRLSHGNGGRGPNAARVLHRGHGSSGDEHGPEPDRGHPGSLEHHRHRYHDDRPGRSHHHGEPVPRLHAPYECLILDGLPDDVREHDILAGLDYVSGDPRLSADQIKSVRIRTNRRGSRIAFVEFYRLPDATRFYDEFYPEIPLPLQHAGGAASEPVIVTIDYSRPREESDRRQERTEDQGWDCTNCGGVNYPHRAVCYKCKTERPDNMEGYSGYSSGPILTGETDEDLRQNPSQFIVIRDLEPSVTEELLSKGVMKLFRDEAPQPARDPSKPINKLKSTAPSNSSVGLGATPGSLRRVFLIRDKRTNDSWKYGFAEFATIDDARGAVAKFNASPRFTIASKPVIVAFIHTGVFVPVLEPVTEQTASFSFAPIYNPSLRVKYWDDRAYPSSHVVSAGPELAPADAKASAATDDKAGSSGQDAAAKKKKDREALAAKIAAKKALVMGPQMQMWAKKAAEIHGASGKSAEGEPSESSAADKTAASATSSTRAEKPTDPIAPSWRDQYTSYADWDTIECLLCGKFSNEEWLIYHETHTHNHYRDVDTKTKAAALLASRSKEPRTVVRRTPRRRCDDPQPYTSYADHDSLTCHLCARKLPSVKMLRRHEQESELHKRNLADAAAVEKARAKLADLGLKPTRMLPLGYDGPVRQSQQYRDRARERRQVYNQPKKPSAAPSATTATAVSNKRKPADEPVPAEEPAAKKSKGAGLLAKMGWTAGEGLGASGDGRTEAVGADVYVPGVGLGAEGAKLGDAGEEAARKMVPGDFVEKTRERARERFERLQ